MKLPFYYSVERGLAVVELSNGAGVAMLGKDEEFDLAKGVSIALLKAHIPHLSTTLPPILKKSGMVEFDYAHLANAVAAASMQIGFAFGSEYPTRAWSVLEEHAPDVVLTLNN